MQVGRWGKALAKSALSVNLFLPLVGARRYVFCYHDVSEPGAPGHSPDYSTPPGVFRRQIDALSRCFEWVDVEELLATPRPKRHLAALTFDDGFASVRDVAWPFLRSRGIPFAVFVCRAAIEDNCLAVTARARLRRLGVMPAPFAAVFAAESAHDGYASPRWNDAILEHREVLAALGLLDGRIFLDAGDVRFLKDRGVRFGSHSATHRVLTACNTGELEIEIDGNRRFMAERLGIDSRHFAVPFGKKTHYDSRVLDVLARHGYRYVYISNPVSVGPGVAAPIELVPRIALTDEDPATVMFYVNRPFLRRIDL